VGLGLVLAGCPSTDVPGLDDGFGPGSSTGERPNITTFNSTVDPTLPPDGGSMEADGTTDVPPTSGSTDASTDPGTTTDPTASGTTTDPGSTSGATADPTDPGSTGSTTGDGCNDVLGNYEYCLNMVGGIDTTPCGAPGDATCLYTGMLANPTAAVCSVDGCTDACDCPAAPPSGSAVVSCDDVTGDPTNQLCYLDCGGGEACPTGMTCFAGFLCMWPGPGAGGAPYGNCFADPAACGLSGICLNNGAMPTIGVCTEACMVVGNCPAAPPGGTSPVACQDITGDGAPECFINCSGGATCPAGMTCYGNFLCAWS
jgi:hypothetical protein